MEYHRKRKEKKSISVDNIFSVTEDKAGNIWCATTEGVCRFDTLAKKFTNYLHDAKDPGSLGFNFVNGRVYVDRHGTIWAGTAFGGLDRFVPETKSFIRYKTEANNLYSIGCNDITSIFEDNSNM